MFRINSMKALLRQLRGAALACIAAGGCNTSDATKPETLPSPAVGSVKIETARVPDKPLSSMDTISVRAIVRDTNGNLMSGVSVTWDLRLVAGETSYSPAGHITQTGPTTAVVALQAPQGIVVADAKGIWGELVLSLGSSTPGSGALVALPFLWSAERGSRLIPVPPDARTLYPADLNDSGEVAGTIVDSEGHHTEPFIWSEARGLTRFGPIPGFQGSVIVKGISAGGIVTGYISSNTSNGSRAFVASRAEGIRVLPGDSWAASINDAGVVSGSGATGPLLWSALAGFEPLPPTDSECTVPTDINNRGQVLGWSGNELFGMGCVPQTWLLWNGLSDPIPLVQCPEGCSLEMRAFNDLGIIAAQLVDTAVRMRITSGTTVTAMERLNAATALDINEAGDIVGGAKSNAVSAYWTNKPYLWSVKGDVTHIPVPTLHKNGVAAAINNRGEIVGTTW